MPLSWNEIRSRALEFSKRWENETSEDAEAKSFWNEFLNIYGIDRKRVASFEEPVKKLGDKQGYIDLFWKGVLLVEHKSRGKKSGQGLHPGARLLPRHQGTRPAEIRAGIRLRTLPFIQS